MNRPLCQNCKIRPAAINYIKNNKKHYRSKCDACIKESKTPGIKPNTPTWQLSGYKKRLVCEQCGFKAINHRQIVVFYIDGNLKNNNWANLKSVCANCVIEISIKGLDWVSDDIRPDF